ncbi:MAG TPA: hypothetical protein VFV28_06740, partial [Limnobacter sp.]|nr:hypothetical protein [Limnobacter sp.]
MGWFNNTLTMNRASNSLALVSAAAVLEESRTTLSAANQFVSQQKQRGNNLSAQAFSVQGASSTIGRSLQQAINDLGDFERDSREVGEDLDDRLQTLGLVVEQFSMPRAQRALNMSGREMASGMLENSGEVV